MLQIVLLIVILLSTIIVVMKHGVFSIVGVGVIGMISYSVPSIFGMTYAYDEPNAIRSATDMAVSLHIVFWVVFLFVIIFSGKTKNKTSFDMYKMSVAATACLYLSILLYLWISMQDGPLYFLGDRQLGEDANAAIIKIIWSWVVAFGLISSLVSRRFFVLFYFVVMMLINMVAGDRGLPIFIMMSIFIVTLNNNKLFSIITDIRIYIISSLLIFIIFMAKPFYIFIKTGEFTENLNFIPELDGLYFIKSFEPFVIHNTLELVIEDGFSYKISYLFKGILGQLLLFPSLIGVSSAEWNRQYQDFLNQDLGYGVAYSYIAQAYSIGGLVCVVAFAILFSFVLIILNKAYQKLSGISAILVLQLGVVWGVFIYRNSLENMVAIFKQILIAYVLMIIVYHMIMKMKSAASAS